MPANPEAGGRTFIERPPQGGLSRFTLRRLRASGCALVNPMKHPCLRCGVCCAFFRVSFHWSEADASLGGRVPPEFTEKLDPHRLAMRGTDEAKPRCVALQGTLGVAAHCGIYARRPSVCREVEPSWEFGRVSLQCDKARLAHGMPLLTPQDWLQPFDSDVLLPQVA